MKELEEKRALVCVCVCVSVGVKFCCNLGKNFTETFQLLNQAFGEDCVSRTQCYEWNKRFKDCRMSVGEDVCKRKKKKRSQGGVCTALQLSV
jgi:hypothetical protein